MQDYYEILGVDHDASDEVIKHVYRQLARAYHPDLIPENAAGITLLKRINEAYETLSDPVKRCRYDATLGVRATRPRQDGQGSSRTERESHSAEEQGRRRTREAEERTRRERSERQRAEHAQRERAERARQEEERRREAGRAADQAKADQARREREKREERERRAAQQRAREEVRRRKREAMAAADAVLGLAGSVSVEELLSLVGGLESVATDIAFASLQRIAEFAGPAGEHAAEAVKRIEVHGTRPVGSFLPSWARLGDANVIARSIATERVDDLGRSLGLLVGNPTPYNLQVLIILATEGQGRAGQLARIALGQDVGIVVEEQQRQEPHVREDSRGED